MSGNLRRLARHLQPFIEKVSTLRITLDYVPAECIQEGRMRQRAEAADLDQYLPLTPTVFDILLALWKSERHGYGIMREVRFASDGRVVLRPGTLYRALSRLLELGLVAESDVRPDPELDDERRRYYSLTDLGKRVLKAEAGRLVHQVNAARAKKLIHGRI